MIKSEVFLCEKCGKAFGNTEGVLEHEKKCLDLRVGQKVKFLFMMTHCEGHITALHEPAILGAEPTVDLESEYEITDVDIFHDGKHVFVTRENVLEIIL